MGDIFGDRMKEYEAVADAKLTRKLPIIVRLDGNSFSKFTKVQKFQKPYDPVFCEAMLDATQALLSYCSGAQIGYTQSDEITLLLRNDQTPDTQPFLANRVEKICSLLASTAAVEFSVNLTMKLGKPIKAAFDARVYVIPHSEVNNSFLWRQMDAWHNCVSAVSHYGLKEKYGSKTAQKMLHGKSLSDRHEIIFRELGFNMNDYPVKYKRGVCIRRKPVRTPIEQLMSLDKVKKLGKLGEVVERSIWEPDYNIPRFDQDPSYIEGLLENKKELAG